MNLQQYYQPFSDSLHELLKNNKSNRVNGVSKFVEFVIDLQNSGELDPQYDDLSHEQLEQIVHAQKSSLIEWFRQNTSSWLAIKTDSSWLYKSKMPSALPIIAEFGQVKLNQDEEVLLNTNVTNLNDSNLAKLHNIYYKLESRNDNENKAKCSLKIAEIGFKYSHRVDNAKDWEKAASDNREVNPDTAFVCYKRAGEIFSSNYRYDSAAYCFQEAKRLKNYKVLNNAEKKEYQKLLTDCRLQFERAGLNDDASNIFIEENDNKKYDANNFTKFLLGLYKLIANYGESPMRVICAAMFVISISTLFYWCAGITSDGKEINDFGISCYFSFVTFTTLGYGDFSPTPGLIRVIATIESLSGLMLTSLFMVTLVRKYSR